MSAASPLAAAEPSCVFCDQPSETKEHVVPKWLLRHFDLYNQRLLLSNQTTLTYRQAVVPACRHCNSERLAPLERRIQDNTASTRDYFLWALKITTCLSYRDATLPLDRRDPAAGTVVPADSFVETATLLKHGLLSLDRPDFRFSPDPFGSVMFLPTASNDFALVDVPRPYRALAVALPGRGHLVVLAGDRGVLATIYKRLGSVKALEQLAPVGDAQTQLTGVIFGMLILRSHLAIPHGIRLDPDVMIADPIPRRIPMISQGRELYREIAAMLHLGDAVADLAYERYAETFRAGAHMRWR